MNLKQEMSSYHHYTDCKLAHLLKENDHAAFAEIYRRYAKDVYIHAYKKIKDRELAKDIVQDLFTALWNRRSEFELKTVFSAYLFTAVRNRVIKTIAHQKLESAFLKSLGDFVEQHHRTADHLARTNQLQKHIEKEVKALPDKMQAVFRLSRQSNLSHKEIADQFDISEATVKKQVNNALKILRVKLSSLQSFLFPFL
jgi:RNA polymerase sigma-70 factor (family 1)